MSLAPSRSESPFFQHATRSVEGRRGFTLLIAVILASVALAIGLALLDISYKQVVLSGAAKQSQVAFYAADSVLECALYYDQQQNSFDYVSPTGGLLCDNGNAAVAVTSYQTSVAGGTRTTSYTVPCPTSGTRGQVTVYKASTGATQIFAQGYNTCDTASARRIERGLKVEY